MSGHDANSCLVISRANDTIYASGRGLLESEITGQSLFSYGQLDIGAFNFEVGPCRQIQGNRLAAHVKRLVHRKSRIIDEYLEGTLKFHACYI